MGAIQQMLVATNSATAASYTTWNSADKDADVALSGSDLVTTTSVASSGVRSVISKTTGKWYWEVTITSAPAPSDRNTIGIANSTANLSGALYNDANAWCYYGGGHKTNGGLSAYGATYGTGDIIGVAFDRTAGTITFYKNNVSQGVAFTGLTGSLFAVYSLDNTGGVTNVTTTNFGATAFTYSPPVGFNSGLYV